MKMPNLRTSVLFLVAMLLLNVAEGGLISAATDVSTLEDRDLSSNGALDVPTKLYHSRDYSSLFLDSDGNDITAKANAEQACKDWSDPPNVEVWPTLKANKHRGQYRTVQINWNVDEVLEGDWVGVFSQDPTLITNLPTHRRSQWIGRSSDQASIHELPTYPPSVRFTSNRRSRRKERQEKDTPISMTPLSNYSAINATEPKFSSNLSVTDKQTLEVPSFSITISKEALRKLANISGKGKSESLIGLNRGHYKKTEEYLPFKVNIRPRASKIINGKRVYLGGASARRRGRDRIRKHIDMDDDEFRKFYKSLEIELVENQSMKYEKHPTYIPGNLDKYKIKTRINQRTKKNIGTDDRVKAVNDDQIEKSRLGGVFIETIPELASNPTLSLHQKDTNSFGVSLLANITNSIQNITVVQDQSVKHLFGEYGIENISWKKSNEIRPSTLNSSEFNDFTNLDAEIIGTKSLSLNSNGHFGLNETNLGENRNLTIPHANYFSEYQFTTNIFSRDLQGYKNISNFDHSSSETNDYLNDNSSIEQIHVLPLKPRTSSSTHSDPVRTTEGGEDALKLTEKNTSKQVQFVTQSPINPANYFEETTSPSYLLVDTDNQYVKLIVKNKSSIVNSNENYNTDTYSGSNKYFEVRNSTSWDHIHVLTKEIENVEKAQREENRGATGRFWGTIENAFTKWKRRHPMVYYSYRPTSTSGKITSNVVFKRPQSDRLAEGGCLGIWVAYIRKGQVLASRCFSSNPTWLWDNRDIFNTMTLRNLALVGAHNAGSLILTDAFDPVDTWVACQDETILDQLLYGVRYLDVRIGYYPETKEKLWINHDIVKWAPLHTLLSDVLAFSKLSPDPVIVDVHRTPIGFTDPEAAEQLILEIQKYLRELVFFRRKGVDSPTVGDMWSAGRSVLFSWSNVNQSKIYEWIWPRIPQAWADAQLVPDLFKFLSDKTDSFADLPFSWAAMGHLTPTFWDLILRGTVGTRGFADRVSPKLKDWISSTTFKQAGNILAIDFFHSTDLVEQFVQLNLVRATCPDLLNRRLEPSTITTTSAPATNFVNMFSTIFQNYGSNPNSNGRTFQVTFPFETQKPAFTELP